MADQRPLSHQQVEQLLAVYRDLSGWEKAAVAEHLATCQPCRALAEDNLQFDNLLKNAAWKQPSPHLSNNFYRAVEADGRSWFHSAFRLGNQLAGVAVLLLVVLSAWLIFRPPSVQTPVETPTIMAVVTAEPVPTPDPEMLLSPRYTLTQTVTNFAFSPEGSYLAAAENNIIYLWQGGTGSHLHTLKEQFPAIESLAFTPNGVNLIARDSSGNFHRWLAFNGAYQQNFNGAQSPVGSPYALGNTTLALVTADNNLELWPLSGSNPKLMIETAATAITTLAISPNGKVIAAVLADGTTSLWDDTGKALDGLSTGPETVSGIVLNGNGRYIATYHENSFQLWQGSSLRRQLPPQPSPALGPITDLRFLSEDHYMMVAYERGFIQMWDLSSGELTRTFYSGPADQGAIALIRDGFLYATLDTQGILTVWDKPKE